MSERKRSKNTLKFLYFTYAIFASFFILMGIGNFRLIIATPEFDEKTLTATLFLVLDIALFFYYNSRALGFLKELRDYDKEKSE